MGFDWMMTIPEQYHLQETFPKCFASSQTTYKNRVVVLYSDQYCHKHLQFV